MNIEELSFHLDPTDCEILGVFGKYMFIKQLAIIETEEYCNSMNTIMRKASNGGVSMSEFPNIEETTIVIKIKVSEFNKLFKGWIEGKRDYCERWNHFCGVMGYYIAEEFKQVGTMILNDYVFNSENDDCVINEIETPVFYVTKWNETPDFEHG